MQQLVMYLFDTKASSWEANDSYTVFHYHPFMMNRHYVFRLNFDGGDELDLLYKEKELFSLYLPYQEEEWIVENRLDNSVDPDRNPLAYNQLFQHLRKIADERRNEEQEAKEREKEKRIESIILSLKEALSHSAFWEKQQYGPFSLETVYTGATATTTLCHENTVYANALYQEKYDRFYLTLVTRNTPHDAIFLKHKRALSDYIEENMKNQLKTDRVLLMLERNLGWLSKSSQVIVKRCIDKTLLLPFEPLNRFLSEAEQNKKQAVQRQKNVIEEREK